MPPQESKPNHPAVGVAYVLLGLLVVLAVSYVAFAWVGKTMPEMAAITTLITQVLLLVVKNKYDRGEERKRISRSEVEEGERDDRRKVVLLVDDNEIQQGLIRSGFWNLRAPFDLFIADSIEQAQDMLKLKPPYQLYPKPDVILLDLVFSKIPNQLQGVDFLRAKMNDPAIFDIPVIIVSGHEKEEFEEHLQVLEVCCKYVRKGLVSTLIDTVKECTDDQQITDVTIRKTGPHQLPPPKDKN